LDEIGTSGDLGDISVRCECGQKRSLIHTARTAERPFPLGYCNGLRPWLGSASREKWRGDAGPALGSRLLIRSASKVDRVVLVHRMREVVAQVGFTRFEAAMTDINGELDLGVRRAELVTDISWLPAVENRGEGVFIVLNQDAIAQWRKSEAAQKREVQLSQGFAAWQRMHPGSQAVFLGAPYVLLDSLSHLLITAVSLECGYAASSIRERIYVSDAGSGILLYTGSPDAEGTLGGLAAVGKRIGQHLRTALELGRLCSNDPVCAQHHPDDRQEERFLHGAACHGRERNSRGDSSAPSVGSIQHNRYSPVLAWG
jgi:hypothetical protein